MTSQEMSLEFDILYNNIASNIAPGIDEYEKSVFLTKAQEQLVTAIYDGSFEGSERLRESINPLVTTITKTSIEGVRGQGVSPNSIFYTFPEDAWYIVYESLTVEDNKYSCNGVKKVIPIKPVLVDEYNRIRNNPFRRARADEALRLNSEGKIEIVSTYPNYTYTVRYIKKPSPIIIGTNYECPEIDGVPLSIRNTGTDVWEPNNKDCELLDAIHRTIVESAVNLAIAAYKSTNN